MAAQARPVRWVDDVGPSAWWLGRIGGPAACVGALVPGGFEAYGQLIFPAEVREPGALPDALARALIDLLRPETSTPDRCWFCVPENRPLDDQGVTGRVHLTNAPCSYLLYAGAVESAIACAPARRYGLGLVGQPGLTVAQIAAALNEEGGGRTMFALPANAAPQEILDELARRPAFLDEAAASIWWPEDQAWFLATPHELAITYLAGSRRLIDRLQADPRLQVRPAELTDSVSPAYLDAQERQFGPVIASGGAGSWQLRGRIDDEDKVWSSVEGPRGGSGGSGALPFRYVGGKKLGHFGTMGWGGSGGSMVLQGVVSRQVAAVDVRLSKGVTLAAQIVDTGDLRAQFFVASWPSADRWEALVARDGDGRELEVMTPPFRA